MNPGSCCCRAEITRRISSAVKYEIASCCVHSGRQTPTTPKVLNMREMFHLRCGAVVTCSDPLTPPALALLSNHFKAKRALRRLAFPHTAGPPSRFARRCQLRLWRPRPNVATLQPIEPRQPPPFTLPSALARPIVCVGSAHKGSLSRVRPVAP